MQERRSALPFPRRGAFLLSLLLVVAAGPAPIAQAPASCQMVDTSAVNLSDTLRHDLAQSGCWQLPAGTFGIDSPVGIPPGGSLQGAGIDQTRVVAQGWQQVNGVPVGGGSQMITTTGTCVTDLPCRAVLDLTIDGNLGAAPNVLGADGLRAERVGVTGGACSGVEIDGSGATLINDVIDSNGLWFGPAHAAQCPGVVDNHAGPGIYLQASDPKTRAGCWQATITGAVSCPARDVLISGNQIANSGSMGIDSNGFSGDWYGGSDPASYVQVTGNTIAGHFFDGISLYDSSRWSISSNTIWTNPANSPADRVPHPSCDGTRTGGSWSAAVNICVDDQPWCAGSICRVYESNGDLITGNRLADGYGVVSLGVLAAVTYSDSHGSWRATTTHYPSGGAVTANDPFGSRIGIAQDP